MNKTAEYYQKAATKPNTKKAYQSDIRDFVSSGYELPASTADVNDYLAKLGGKLKSTTLQRRMAALSLWHKLASQPDPTAHPSVRLTISGIKQVHPEPPAKQATPITYPLLVTMLNNMQAQTLIELRDRALLLTGWWLALRASDLRTLTTKNIRRHPQGLELYLSQSKGDRQGLGEWKLLPKLDSQCPCEALNKWREENYSTALFPSIKKSGEIGANALSTTSIRNLLIKRATAAGIENADSMSTHSLRRGFASSIGQQLGASALQEWVGWKSINTAQHYIGKDPILIKKLREASTAIDAGVNYLSRDSANKNII